MRSFGYDLWYHEQRLFNNSLHSSNLIHQMEKIKMNCWNFIFFGKHVLSLKSNWFYGIINPHIIDQLNFLRKSLNLVPNIWHAYHWYIDYINGICPIKCLIVIKLVWLRISCLFYKMCIVFKHGLLASMCLMNFLRFAKINQNVLVVGK